jgi:hypothetical protein
MRTSVFIGLAFWLGASNLFAQLAEQKHLVIAPDKKYAVMWSDSDLALTPPRWIRIITVFQIDPPEIILSRVTFPRWTGAAWNNGSSCLALFDDPDNGNSFLWILSKGPNTWRSTKIDVLDRLEKAFPINDPLKLARGGIDSIHWSSNDELNCGVTYENSQFDLMVNRQRETPSVQIQEKR